MIWYVCLCLGMLLLLSAGRVALNERLGKLRSGIALLLLLAATYVFYIPAFLDSYVREGVDIVVDRLRGALADPVRDAALDAPAQVAVQDRKSTRLNSSHTT